MKLASSKSAIRQLTTGSLVCLSSFGYGMALCWLSITEQVLRSDAGAGPHGSLSDSQISWLGSLPYLGSIFGALFWSSLIDIFGRKNVFILSMIPFVMSHSIFVFSKNYYLLLFSRFFSGVGIIGTQLNTPGYIAETCQAKIKSIVSSLFVIDINFATLLMYVIGANTSYLMFNIIITVIPVVIIVILFVCIPESPVHLMKKGKDKEARNILKWLRATEDEDFVQKEFDTLKESFLNMNERSKSLTLKDIFGNRYYLKALSLGMILQSSIAMSGIGMITTYLNNILRIALKQDDTNKYSTFLSSAIFLGSFSSFFVFHRFNRKVFVVGCNAIVALCLFSSGLLLYLRSINVYTVNPLAFIILLSIFMYTQGIGLSTSVYTIAPELFAVECRNQFCALLLFLHFSMLLTVTKLYPVLVTKIHLYGWFFIFSVYSFFTMLFGIFILPETKGRNIQQIFNKLCKNQEIVISAKQKNNESRELF